MVFIVTKAALAATLVGLGVTFGALSYLSRKNQEQNGVPQKGFEFSFPTKELPPLQISSSSLSSSPVGFNLFSSVNCNCKVVTECDSIAASSSAFSFRFGRTCGFQGFQRKVCCEEVQFFSTPPPYVALDEIKSMHAQLEPSCDHDPVAQGFPTCNCDGHIHPHHLKNDTNNKSESSFRDGGPLDDEHSMTTTSSVVIDKAHSPPSTITTTEEAVTKGKLSFPDISEYFPEESNNGTDSSTTVSREGLPFEVIYVGNKDGQQSAQGINSAFDETEPPPVASSMSPKENSYFTTGKFPSLDKFFPDDDASSNVANNLATTTQASLSSTGISKATPNDVGETTTMSADITSMNPLLSMSSSQPEFDVTEHVIHGSPAGTAAQSLELDKPNLVNITKPGEDIAMEGTEKSSTESQQHVTMIMMVETQTSVNEGSHHSADNEHFQDADEHSPSPDSKVTTLPSADAGNVSTSISVVTSSTMITGKESTTPVSEDSERALTTTESIMEMEFVTSISSSVEMSTMQPSSDSSDRSPFSRSKEQTGNPEEDGGRSVPLTESSSSVGNMGEYIDVTTMTPEDDAQVSSRKTIENEVESTTLASTEKEADGGIMTTPQAEGGLEHITAISMIMTDSGMAPSEDFGNMSTSTSVVTSSTMIIGLEMTTASSDDNEFTTTSEAGTVSHTKLQSTSEISSTTLTSLNNEDIGSSSVDTTTTESALHVRLSSEGPESSITPTEMSPGADTTLRGESMSSEGPVDVADTTVTPTESGGSGPVQNLISEKPSDDQTTMSSMGGDIPDLFTPTMFSMQPDSIIATTTPTTAGSSKQSPELRMTESTSEAQLLTTTDSANEDPDEKEPVFHSDPSFQTNDTTNVNDEMMMTTQPSSVSNSMADQNNLSSTPSSNQRDGEDVTTEMPTTKSSIFDDIVSMLSSTMSSLLPEGLRTTTENGELATTVRTSGNDVTTPFATETDSQTSSPTVKNKVTTSEPSSISISSEVPTKNKDSTEKTGEQESTTLSISDTVPNEDIIITTLSPGTDGQVFTGTTVGNTLESTTLATTNKESEVGIMTTPQAEVDLERSTVGKDDMFVDQGQDDSTTAKPFSELPKASTSLSPIIPTTTSIPEEDPTTLSASGMESIMTSSTESVTAGTLKIIEIHPTSSTPSTSSASSGNATEITTAASDSKDEATTPISSSDTLGNGDMEDVTTKSPLPESGETSTVTSPKEMTSEEPTENPHKPLQITTMPSPMEDTGASSETPESEIVPTTLKGDSTDDNKMTTERLSDGISESEIQDPITTQSSMILPDPSGETTTVSPNPESSETAAASTQKSLSSPEKGSEDATTLRIGIVSTSDAEKEMLSTTTENLEVAPTTTRHSEASTETNSVGVTDEATTMGSMETVTNQQEFPTGRRAPPLSTTTVSTEASGTTTESSHKSDFKTTMRTDLDISTSDPENEMQQTTTKDNFDVPATTILNSESVTTQATMNPKEFDASTMTSPEDLGSSSAVTTSTHKSVTEKNFETTTQPSGMQDDGVESSTATEGSSSSQKSISDSPVTTTRSDDLDTRTEAETDLPKIGSSTESVQAATSEGTTVANRIEMNTTLKSKSHSTEVPTTSLPDSMAVEVPTVTPLFVMKDFTESIGVPTSTSEGTTLASGLEMESTPMPKSHSVSTEAPTTLSNNNAGIIEEATTPVPIELASATSQQDLTTESHAQQSSTTMTSKTAEETTTDTSVEMSTKGEMMNDMNTPDEAVTTTTDKSDLRSFSEPSTISIANAESTTTPQSKDIDASSDATTSVNDSTKDITTVTTDSPNMPNLETEDTSSPVPIQETTTMIEDMMTTSVGPSTMPTTSKTDIANILDSESDTDKTTTTASVSSTTEKMMNDETDSPVMSTTLASTHFERTSLRGDHLSTEAATTLAGQSERDEETATAKPSTGNDKPERATTPRLADSEDSTDLSSQTTSFSTLDTSTEIPMTSAKSAEGRLDMSTTSEEGLTTGAIKDGSRKDINELGTTISPGDDASTSYGTTGRISMESTTPSKRLSTKMSGMTEAPTTSLPQSMAVEVPTVTPQPIMDEIPAQVIDEITTIQTEKFEKTTSSKHQEANGEERNALTSTAPTVEETTIMAQIETIETTPQDNETPLPRKVPAGRTFENEISPTSETSSTTLIRTTEASEKSVEHTTNYPDDTYHTTTKTDGVSVTTQRAEVTTTGKVSQTESGKEMSTTTIPDMDEITTSSLGSNEVAATPEGMTNVEITTTPKEQDLEMTSSVEGADTTTSAPMRTSSETSVGTERADLQETTSTEGSKESTSRRSVETTSRRDEEFAPIDTTVVPQEQGRTDNIKEYGTTESVPNADVMRTEMPVTTTEKELDTTSRIMEEESTKSFQTPTTTPSPIPVDTGASSESSRFDIVTTTKKVDSTDDPIVTTEKVSKEMSDATTAQGPSMLMESTSAPQNVDESGTTTREIPHLDIVSTTLKDDSTGDAKMTTERSSDGMFADEMQEVPTTLGSLTREEPAGKTTTSQSLESSSDSPASTTTEQSTSSKEKGSLDSVTTTLTPGAEDEEIEPKTTTETSQISSSPVPMITTMRNDDLGGAGDTGKEMSPTTTENLDMTHTTLHPEGRGKTNSDSVMDEVTTPGSGDMNQGTDQQELQSGSRVPSPSTTMASSVMDETTTDSLSEMSTDAGMNDAKSKQAITTTPDTSDLKTTTMMTTMRTDMDSSTSEAEKEIAQTTAKDNLGISVTTVKSKKPDESTTILPDNLSSLESTSATTTQKSMTSTEKNTDTTMLTSGVPADEVEDITTTEGSASKDKSTSSSLITTTMRNDDFDNTTEVGTEMTSSKSSKESVEDSTSEATTVAGLEMDSTPMPKDSYHSTEGPAMSLPDSMTGEMTTVTPPRVIDEMSTTEEVPTSPSRLQNDLGASESTPTEREGEVTTQSYSSKMEEVTTLMAGEEELTEKIDSSTAGKSQPTTASSLMSETTTNLPVDITETGRTTSSSQQQKMEETTTLRADDPDVTTPPTMPPMFDNEVTTTASERGITIDESATTQMPFKMNTASPSAETVTKASLETTTLAEMTMIDKDEASTTEPSSTGGSATTDSTDVDTTRISKGKDDVLDITEQPTSSIPSATSQSLLHSNDSDTGLQGGMGQTTMANEGTTTPKSELDTSTQMAEVMSTTGGLKVGEIHVDNMTILQTMPLEMSTEAGVGTSELPVVIETTLAPPEDQQTTVNILDDMLMMGPTEGMSDNEAFMNDSTTWTTTASGLEGTTTTDMSTSVNESHASYGATTEYPDDVTMTMTTSQLDMKTSTTPSMIDRTTTFGADSDSVWPITEITKSVRREPDTDRTIVEITQMLSLLRTRVDKSVRREPDTDKTVVELVKMLSLLRTKVGKNVEALRTSIVKTITEYMGEGWSTTTADYSTLIPTSTQFEESSTMTEVASTTTGMESVNDDEPEGSSIPMGSTTTTTEDMSTTTNPIVEDAINNTTTDVGVTIDYMTVTEASSTPEYVSTMNYESDSGSNNDTLLVFDSNTASSLLIMDNATEIADEVTSHDVLVMGTTPESSSSDSERTQTRSPLSEAVTNASVEKVTEVSSNVAGSSDLATEHSLYLPGNYTGVSLLMGNITAVENATVPSRIELSTNFGVVMKDFGNGTTESYTTRPLHSTPVVGNEAQTTPISMPEVLNSMSDIPEVEPTTGIVPLEHQPKYTTQMPAANLHHVTEILGLGQHDTLRSDVKETTATATWQHDDTLGSDVTEATTTGRPETSGSDVTEASTMGPWDLKYLERTTLSTTPEMIVSKIFSSSAGPSIVVDEITTMASEAPKIFGQVTAEEDATTQMTLPEVDVNTSSELTFTTVLTPTTRTLESFTDMDSTSILPSTSNQSTSDESSPTFLEEIYDNFFGPSGRTPKPKYEKNPTTILPTTTLRTTTTEAPPFKLEVKVGPYDGRSLFSSHSTSQEKELEGEISNVVSQLLLTAHRNFHLLPTFTECAGARGQRGRRKTRVLHFDTDNYPWMARVGHKERGGVTFPCAGTIVARRYVLTSADCATRRNNASDIFNMEILLEGAKNAATGNSDQLRYKYKVEEVIAHPNYDPVTRENDLALIRLSAEIPFNSSTEIKPICLPFEDGYGVWDSLPNEGQTAYLGGWGYGLRNMAAQVELMEDAAVTIWSNDNCTYLYRGDYAKRITQNHICAYGKAEKDACRGDNGGPLMALMTRQKIFFQIGIVSYGPRCGYGVPGVYTRVSPYLSWILDTIEA